mgnify:CR=1 FL=1
MPAIAGELDRVQAAYIELPGWGDELLSARKWSELPPNVLRFIDKISKLCGVKVSLVSVGAERSSTIFSEDADYILKFMQ